MGIKNLSNIVEARWFDRFILYVIILNSVIIFLQESGVDNSLIRIIDTLCIFIFIVEMVLKHISLGVRNYWKSGWNVMDGVLVIVSIPAFISYFIPTQMIDLSILIILRVFRVFRFFRLVHAFGNFQVIVRNLLKALKDSAPIFLGFVVLIIVFALLNCAIFKDFSPEYFGTPWAAMYSTFRLCTLEGWYEIPDSIAANLSAACAGLVRFYFIFLLVSGGIIGLSLVNSIFVDAMVSDNNNDLEKEVKELKAMLQQQTEEIKKLQK